AVATAWPSTPAEFLQTADVQSLASLIELYLSGQASSPDLKPAAALPEPAAPQRPHTAPPVDAVLGKLIETYAPSSHEENMRKAVAQLLPAWAKPTTDDAGNLILRWPSSSSHAQRIAVVAHMDEIGYEVHSILPDGRLELESKGGG